MLVFFHSVINHFSIGLLQLIVPTLGSAYIQVFFPALLFDAMKLSMFLFNYTSFIISLVLMCLFSSISFCNRVLYCCSSKYTFSFLFFTIFGIFILSRFAKAAFGHFFASPKEHNHLSKSILIFQYYCSFEEKLCWHYPCHGAL